MTNEPSQAIAEPLTCGFQYNPDANDPIRAELYSPERLDEHARQLALRAASSVRPGRPLLRRFKATSRELARAHRVVTDACREEQALGTDAEWFIDNFHIIEDSLREVYVDLPGGYYAELPKLDDGPLAGFPRIYALALELLAHTDSGIDENHITRVVQAYQTGAPLTIGELWAVPSMLRLATLENLRRLAHQMVRTREERCAADEWASAWRVESPEADAAPTMDWNSRWSRFLRARRLKRMLPQHDEILPNRSDSFVVRLLLKLRDFGPSAESVVELLEQRLDQLGVDPVDVLQRENQRQAANQVSVGNCVTSLRLLSALDWTAFFERTSHVEKILREDPAGIYGRQDFATKDRYRQSVERLARGTDSDELSVARRVVAAARRDDSDPRHRHVGYYLIDRGRRELEAELGFRPAVRERILRALLQHPNSLYFGLIAVLLAGGWAGLAAAAAAGSGPWAAAGLALLTLLPICELAVGITNHLVTRLVPPRVLPKLELDEGVPADSATFVVIPSMLLDGDSAAHLAERLEVHYLANPEANLRFALLTDFADAPAEAMPEDELLLDRARSAIEALNQRYGHGTDRFFLCHRRRVWNPVQGCFMGWERKRGKLLEFFGLLRGAGSGTFATVVGDMDSLPPIRYCITLDSDTSLPRETARRLVGILSHPLNAPQFDGTRGLVLDGYSVLQPRVSFGIGAISRSIFARLFTGSAGIDPYTTAVSDVYQDLFGVGSYTGKGIVEIDAFRAAVGATFPDNHILSHDLIEGNYARCALVTDVELLDEFPGRYETYAAREHRWVRGDWQLVPWLFPTVPVARSASDSARPVPRRRNPLPLLARWKIVDNLRRSLVAPSLLLMAAAGWLASPLPAWIWTALIVAVVALPLELRVCDAVLVVLARRRGLGRLRELRGELPHTAGQVLLSLAFLADQARTMLDAIVRTVLRIGVTRRRLLEWESAAAAERRLNRGFALRAMWMTSLVTAALAGAIAVFRPGALAAALPLLLAWFGSPVLAWLASRPLRPRETELTPVERRELRRIARMTWAFFETFIGDKDHWLPPDNYQEDPKGQIAHRTSPTNIGMLLVSTLAADDLGYIGRRDLIERLEQTFDTLDRLDRYQGHLYNWYDTQTLRPLQPQYVSTVDSGNLLGCLLVLKQGLMEKLGESERGAALRDGLGDTVALLAESFAAVPRPPDPELATLYHEVGGAVEDLVLRVRDAGGGAGGDEPALVEWDRAAVTLVALVRALADSVDRAADELVFWSGRLAVQVQSWRESAGDPLGQWAAERMRRLAERADRLATGMNFRFLYNDRRHLFVVGYNATQGRADNAHYDLLASEACLTSLLAIARGEASKKHWFQLARPLAGTSSGAPVLVSWGGTMFEYLMPRLLLRTYPGTLLHESHVAAVARQIEYGKQRRVPWGISESAFSVLDVARDYQYQSFGVPGLGLKRGLVDELVIAPYATALALAVRPRDALRNFRTLAAEGAEGRYGFYEAIDYTRTRLPERQRSIVVRCFMAHHQGMILSALANCLLDNPMPRRFHTDPIVRAVDLLLQERVPRSPTLMEPHSDEAAAGRPIVEGSHPMIRRLSTPATATPRTHLLSNGRYHVFVSNSLGGSSCCRGIDVTRWREDRTRDCWGQFHYVRDLRTHTLWCAGYQPLCRTPDRFEVIYSVDKAEFRRVDGDIGTNLEIVVPTDHLAEIRRLTLVNYDRRPHRIEVTSYSELVLGPHGADLAHPAFGKLFLETEFLAAHDALLCRRRPRSDDQKPIWAVQVLAVDGQFLDPVQYETDRLRFIGRGRSTANPAALEPGAVLSGTVGAVLDPVFSLRRRVRVPAGGSVTLAFTTAIADSRDEALALADQYHDYHSVAHAFELAWAHSQVELRHLNLTGEEAHLFQRLATHILFTSPTLRPPLHLLSANRQGQSALWRYGISGDKPILLVRISNVDDVPAIRRLLVAHAYFRRKGLELDLVIICEEASSYFEELYHQVQQVVRASDSHSMIDVPGGIFVRKATHMPEEDRILVQAAARVVLNAARSLAGQLSMMDPSPQPAADLDARPPAAATADSFNAARGDAVRPSDAALFWNGTGGFREDGREYVLRADAIATTPAPWINVVANPSFGFLVSETGAGFTWAGNSQSNRLTPWSNDPVGDPPGEVVYLRDESSGDYWTVTPAPAGPPSACVIRHGQGYSTFERDSHGLHQSLRMLVPICDPVKLFVLTVRNSGRRRRELSATFYAEWVLGTVRDQSAMHLVSREDEPSGALVVQNPFNSEFATRVAFADVNLRPRRVTADRTEFIGRNGSLSAPAALARTDLSGRTGANLDPCAAIRVAFELQPGEERQIVFLLGQAESVDGVRQLAERYRAADGVHQAFDAVTRHWDQVLGCIQVRTPNQALDLLMNRWLLYQSLSCRVWGRSGFYQSSGAYGFRDQLQDVMALVYGLPGEARTHILRAAGRQFREGDVQHWWHPPAGRGVRTRCSDDFLWLPFATCHYVETTGDRAILDEPVPFLEAPSLKPDQEEDYRLPDVSDESASLYEHCVRAVENGLRFGDHGLPLIGTCDWNDGFNRVGHHGRGESVWNGWFLIVCLGRMADLASSRGETGRAERYRRISEEVREAIERHGWDGGWYRRAYFDDGTPVGSSTSDECQIDSLTQSWAVSSGAADPSRAEMAMRAVVEQLVDPRDRLIRLFTPPWDKSAMHPGYVKGYVPGIRENGGQYTHAATWVVQAAATLGRGELAIQLFDMLNPITHTSTPVGVQLYKTEPYAVAADVYSEPPHTGRGGWTWYTGSAAWLYRVALEKILGFQLRGDRLTLQPSIPADWPGFELVYQFHSASYRIRLERVPADRGDASPHISVDGQAVGDSFVRLVDDGREHDVLVLWPNDSGASVGERVGNKMISGSRS